MRKTKPGRGGSADNNRLAAFASGTLAGRSASTRSAARAGDPTLSMTLSGAGFPAAVPNATSSAIHRAGM